MRSVIIIFLFLQLSAFTQEVVEIQFHPDDSFLNYTQTERDSVYLRLPSVEKSEYPIHFRFQLFEKIVDVFGGVDGYQGIVTTHLIREEETKKEGEIIKYVLFSKWNLDTTLCRNVADYFKDNLIIEIPTDSLLNNWSMSFFDCYAAFFEFKINSEFVSKRYVCPQGQKDSVENVERILVSIAFLNETLELDTLMKDFLFSLPEGTYTNGHCWYYVPGPPKKITWIRKAWGRTKLMFWSYLPKYATSDYLMSIEDSLNTVIEGKVQNRLDIMEEVPSVYDYYLRFSKRGKLKGVSFPKKGDWRWYRSSLKEDKRILRKALKSIKIEGLETNFGFYKRFTISDGKIDVY